MHRAFSLSLPLIILITLNMVRSQPELPTLPSRFTAIVEANIIQKNRTVYMEEWYDQPANKVKMEVYRGNLINTIYEDFDNGNDQRWTYTTTHDDTSNALTCKLESYSQNRQPFGFGNQQTSSGNLVSSSEWFQFGSNFSETYIGNNFVIRGIKCEGWTRNVSETFPAGPTTTFTMNYEITYYFSLPSWNWFNSSESRIPVRVELKGSRTTDNGTISTYNFHHYYDYVQFFPDDLTLAEELDFDIPDFYEQCDVTSYCAVYPSNQICTLTKGPELPKISEAFTATWEFTISSESSNWGPGRFTSLVDVYYDYERNSQHNIWYLNDGYYDNAWHILDIFEDDKDQSWTWIGDGVESTPITSDDDVTECSMSQSAPDYTGYDYYIIAVENGHIATPNQFFFFDDNKYEPDISDEVWLGYTEIRGIKAEKWKATFNHVVNGDEPTLWLPAKLESNQRAILNGTTYWYWSSNWTFGWDLNVTSRPLQLDLDFVYQLYNTSDNGATWDLIANSTVLQRGAITNWITGRPDDAFFEPPTYWRRYCTISEDYCINKPDEDVCDTGDDLPTLPQHKYFAILEGNDVETNSTHITKVWYNYDANEIRTEYTNDANIVVTYDDLDEDRRWTWVHEINDTDNIISCKVETYTSTISSTAERFAEEYIETGHVKTVEDLWQFGPKYNITYLGDEFTIRDIGARVWHSETADTFIYNGTNTTASWETIFYFATDDWNYYDAIETADVPIAVEFKGEWRDANCKDVLSCDITSSGTFDTKYQIVSFFSGPQSFDEDDMKFVFEDWYSECDTTAYCDEYPDNALCSLARGPSLPKIPYGFSATWEVTMNDSGDELPGLTGSSLTTIGTSYYDYDNDRIHAVWRFMDGYYENAFHQLDILNDDKDGQSWQWLGDGIGSTPVESDDDIQECNMGRSTGNYTGWDYLIPVSNGHILNPNRLLLFDDKEDSDKISNETFMGYTEKRGIPVQKWRADVYVEVFGNDDDIDELWAPIAIPENQKVIMEGSVYWYFSTANWTFGYMTNESVIPVAVEMAGTYKSYNYSDSTGEYDVLAKSTNIDQQASIIAFLKGQPDDGFFEPPAYWRRYCTISEEYCNNNPSEDVCFTGDELPTLPEHKYFAVLEGNDLINSTTQIMKVWYNYDDNEIRTEVYNDANIVVTYDDLDEDRRWTWVHPINDTDSIISCNVESYKSTISPGGEAFAEEYVDTGHVKTAQDLWRFGENYNITYLGDQFTVRDIDVRVWHSESSTSFEYNGSDTTASWETVFYFATEDWDYYDSIEASDIPLAVEFKGEWSNSKDSGKFDTKYQIVSFFSGQQAFDVEDMEFVFEDWYSECDTTAYCDTYPSNSLCSKARGPEMPSLPDQFFAVLEGTALSLDEDGNIDEYNSGTWVFEEYYDYPGNMAHVILRNGPNWRGDAMHQLDRLDDDQKWIWFGEGSDEDGVIDGDEMYNCVLTPAISNFTGVDVLISETNGHIASPSRWFRWNDPKYTSTDIWHGYTEVRGIPAQKWQALWSEYEEVPGSPLQKTFAANMTARVNYYWSNKTWNLVASNWETVPLKLELSGTYKLYNKSESSGKYDILWTSNSFTSTFSVLSFNAGEQDDENFEIPTSYKECNASLYCNKYPQSDVCLGTVDTGSASSGGDGESDDGIYPGYIVIMVLLFFIGLLLGGALDRCYMRSRAKRVSFQRMQDNEATTDARL